MFASHAEAQRIVEEARNPTPLMEQKVRQLVELMQKPRKEISPERIAVLCLELQALAKEAGDVEPAVFAVLPAEARVGGLLLMLGIFLSALQE